jgi:DNA-binding FrmR family transcriptional regulator
VKVKMATVTDKAQSDLQMRLRRIEGQIRGIIGMLEDGKTCEEVVTQILAARAGMESVAAEVLRCHVVDAMSSRSPDEAREAVLRAITLLAKV